MGALDFIDDGFQFRLHVTLDNFAIECSLVFIPAFASQVCFGGNVVGWATMRLVTLIEHVLADANPDVWLNPVAECWYIPRVCQPVLADPAVEFWQVLGQPFRHAYTAGCGELPIHLGRLAVAAHRRIHADWHFWPAHFFAAIGFLLAPFLALQGRHFIVVQFGLAVAS